MFGIQSDLIDLRGGQAAIHQILSSSQKKTKIKVASGGACTGRSRRLPYSVSHFRINSRGANPKRFPGCPHFTPLYLFPPGLFPAKCVRKRGWIFGGTVIAWEAGGEDAGGNTLVPKGSGSRGRAAGGAPRPRARGPRETRCPRGRDPCGAAASAPCAAQRTRPSGTGHRWALGPWARGQADVRALTPGLPQVQSCALGPGSGAGPGAEVE